LIEDCGLRLIGVSSLRNTDEFANNPKDPKEIDVLRVERSTVYVSKRVQIPAARFSDAWEIFFGLKRFAKMRGFGGFSVRGGVN
jgi:hypothetical protein